MLPKHVAAACDHAFAAPLPSRRQKQPELAWPLRHRNMALLLCQIAGHAESSAAAPPLLRCSDLYSTAVIPQQLLRMCWLLRCRRGAAGSH